MKERRFSAASNVPKGGFSISKNQPGIYVPGTHIAFNESQPEGYHAFANKIWNAARFMFMNVDKVEPGLRPGGGQECPPHT